MNFDSNFKHKPVTLPQRSPSFNTGQGHKSVPYPFADGKMASSGDDDVTPERVVLNSDVTSGDDDDSKQLLNNKPASALAAISAGSMGVVDTQLVQADDVTTLNGHADDETMTSQTSETPLQEAVHLNGRYVCFITSDSFSKVV